MPIIITASQLVGRFHGRDGSRPISGFIFLTAWIPVNLPEYLFISCAWRPLCGLRAGLRPGVWGGAGTEGTKAQGTPRVAAAHRGGVRRRPRPRTSWRELQPPPHTASCRGCHLPRGLVARGPAEAARGPGWRAPAVRTAASRWRSVPRRGRLATQVMPRLIIRLQ